MREEVHRDPPFSEFQVGVLWAWRTYEDPLSAERPSRRIPDYGPTGRRADAETEVELVATVGTIVDVVASSNLGCSPVFHKTQPPGLGRGQSQLEQALSVPLSASAHASAGRGGNLASMVGGPALSMVRGVRSCAAPNDRRFIRR